jgi:extracellular factor (EF) 3-hydroxypalmitic acid methyl ester biosynthesis protein
LGLKGLLFLGEYQIPVTVAFASRASLFVDFIAIAPIPYSTEFEKLVVYPEKGEQVLGPCRLLPVEATNTHQGLLVFKSDVYNFDQLFTVGTLQNVERSFNNLPLVLAQNRALSSEFKKFVADITYELNTQRSFFDQADRQLKHESSIVKEHAFSAILNGEGRKFMRAIDEAILRLEKMTATFSREEHEKHAFYLRKQAWHIIAEAPFLARTNLKPRGYAGDSEMMRMIYANAWEGDSLFGKLLHKHAIETPAAQAVRNRRHFITQTVRSVSLASLRGSTPVRIMSVACGPAAEMQDLFADAESLDRVAITLLDQDREALREAGDGIARVQERHRRQADVTFLNESVRTMLAGSELEKQWGTYQLIYTMGLFDYLTEPVAKAVGKKLLGLLNPGGELIVGNFHVANPTRTYMEYWMDWVLYYRTLDEMVALFADLPGVKSLVEFEESGSQMFLRVRKC